MSVAGSPGPFADLRKVLTGEVIEADAPRYETVRMPAQARFRHVRPRAVVRCACPEDVARTLGFARRSGLHVVPRGGGHCFAGRSSTDGIVLDLSPLRAVSVSPTAVVTVGAGERLAEVYDALHAHGLTLPAGCGAGVGIAGLTLGGGLGILGRRYGLTCDRLRGAQVVLADGRIVDCDEAREPDLFWALRGAGGGQFGVVTSLVLGAVPNPEAASFRLAWRYADAAAVLAAWQEWAPDAPDEVSANLKIVAMGAARPHVVVFGAVLGDPPIARDLIDELVGRVGTGTEMATVANVPHGDLKRALAELEAAEPAQREPAGRRASKSEFFRRPLPAATIADVLDTFIHDRAHDQHRELNFTAMGGAYNRVPAGATAFVHRTERFLLEHVAVQADGSADEADTAMHWVRRSWAGVHPWASGRVYPNFPDPELTDWADAYHGANFARLTQVKRAYDPDGLFRFPQAIPVSHYR